MGTTTTIIAGNMKVMLWFAEYLAKDIPDDKFTFSPVEGMNSAAWCYGHMALYADKVLEILGKQDELGPVDPSWEGLFAMGTESNSLADNYPEREVIMDAFMKRHELISEVIVEFPEDKLLEPNTTPINPENLPTIGHVLEFMTILHPSIHLGQITTIRRCLCIPTLI